jgi:hypothetical protein
MKSHSVRDLAVIVGVRAGLSFIPCEHVVISFNDSLQNSSKLKSAVVNGVGGSVGQAW